MKVVNDADFENEVLKSTTPVLVDFFASWCGPCRQMLPVVEEVAEEKKDLLKIVKMDVDESSQTPNSYDVQSIPTLILFKDGTVLDKKVGSLPKKELVAWLEDSLI